MESFEFYRDEKVIYWERTNFSVQSETYEDAADVVGQLVESGLDETETVSIDGGMILFDTCKQVPVEENEGHATVEFFNSDHELIASNSFKDNSYPSIKNVQK